MAGSARSCSATNVFDCERLSQWKSHRLAWMDCSPQLSVDMLVAEFYHELQLPALEVWDDMCMEICGETAKEMDE
eukprot:125095-Rhodomonas_salina.1